jgi:hypothetical protein
MAGFIVTICGGFIGTIAAPLEGKPPESDRDPLFGPAEGRTRD